MAKNKYGVKTFLPPTFLRCMEKYGDMTITQKMVLGVEMCHQYLEDLHEYKMSPAQRKEANKRSKAGKRWGLPPEFREDDFGNIREGFPVSQEEEDREIEESQEKHKGRFKWKEF